MWTKTTRYIKQFKTFHTCDSKDDENEYINLLNRKDVNILETQTAFDKEGRSHLMVWYLIKK